MGGGTSSRPSPDSVGVHEGTGDEGQHSLPPRLRPADFFLGGITCCFRETMNNEPNDHLQNSFYRARNCVIH